MSSRRFCGGLIVACVVVGLLAIRSLIPTRQATQAGSDWTSRFTGTDPNFTVLITVGKIDFVIPNRLLEYPWPRNAPGILVPCPHPELIHPHADGCLDDGPGHAIYLRIPFDDAPGDLSRAHFVAEVGLEFLPQAIWSASVVRHILISNKNLIVRRVPERDIPGYETFQSTAKESILSVMSSSAIEKDERSYTFFSSKNSVPGSIDCTFDDPNTKVFSKSICYTGYPFSPENLSWPPYPEYRITYHFPGSNFLAADQVGSWLCDKLHGLMRQKNKS